MAIWYPNWKNPKIAQAQLTQLRIVEQQIIINRDVIYTASALPATIIAGASQNIPLGGSYNPTYYFISFSGAGPAPVGYVTFTTSSGGVSNRIFDVTMEPLITNIHFAVVDLFRDNLLITNNTNVSLTLDWIIGAGEFRPVDAL